MQERYMEVRLFIEERYMKERNIEGRYIEDDGIS